MRLVFLYGPPAAGKLTIAKELEKLCGYRVFHNHLTVDLTEIAFDIGTEEATAFSSKLRLEVFEEAAKQGRDGLIFTFCYAREKDDAFVKDIQDLIGRYGGDVCFVQVYCSVGALMDRVGDASREVFRKVRSREGLQRMMDEAELFEAIPFVESLSIDTTGTPPKEAARIIREHYHL